MIIITIRIITPCVKIKDCLKTNTKTIPMNNMRKTPGINTIQLPDLNAYTFCLFSRFSSLIVLKPTKAASKIVTYKV